MKKMIKRLDPNQSGSEADVLYANLHKRIVGQDEAVEQVVNVYQTFLAGMNSPGRPVGNFLFLGPTGTGKTRLVEALAESMVGYANAVIKIDCAEFQHSHEIAKLIGAPPGYLGHRETHPLLSQETLNQYHTDKVKVSFVLFDEIEKASDALWNLLLGIMDKGALTLGDNRRVDFSRCMIFLTSNLGAAEMGQIIKPKIGFNAAEVERQRATGEVDENMQGKLNRIGLEAARRRFTPEFINRLDRLIVFRSLEKSDLRRILDIELDMVQQRISNSAQTKKFEFKLTERAKEFLLCEGTNKEYGARHLKRAIEKSLVHPLSNLITSGQMYNGDYIHVDFDSKLGALTFSKEVEDVSEYEIAETSERNSPLVMTDATVAAYLPRVATATKSSRRA